MPDIIKTTKQWLEDRLANRGRKVIEGKSSDDRILHWSDVSRKPKTGPLSSPDFRDHNDTEIYEYSPNSYTIYSHHNMLKRARVAIEAAFEHLKQNNENEPFDDIKHRKYRLKEVAKEFEKTVYDNATVDMALMKDHYKDAKTDADKQRAKEQEAHFKEKMSYFEAALQQLLIEATCLSSPYNASETKLKQQLKALQNTEVKLINERGRPNLIHIYQYDGTEYYSVHRVTGKFTPNQLKMKAEWESVGAEKFAGYVSKEHPEYTNTTMVRTEGRSNAIEASFFKKNKETGELKEIFTTHRGSCLPPITIANVWEQVRRNAITARNVEQLIATFARTQLGNMTEAERKNYLENDQTLSVDISFLSLLSSSKFESVRGLLESRGSRRSVISDESDQIQQTLEAIELFRDRDIEIDIDGAAVTVNANFITMAIGTNPARNILGTRESHYADKTLARIINYRGFYELTLAVQEKLESLKTTLSPMLQPQLEQVQNLHAISSKIEQQENDPAVAYERVSIPRDGECGYSVSEIDRKGAFKLIYDNLDETVINLLLPAVQEALLEETFINYLKHNNHDVHLEASTCAKLSDENLFENIDNLARNPRIVRAFLFMDIIKKQIGAGYAHQAVLQSLAHIQKIKLRVWKLDENRTAIVPYSDALSEDLYASYTPKDHIGTRDILFVDNNHYDQIEFLGNQTAIGNSSIQSTDILRTKTLAIEERLSEIKSDLANQNYIKLELLYALEARQIQQLKSDPQHDLKKAAENVDLNYTDAEDLDYREIEILKLQESANQCYVELHDLQKGQRDKTLEDYRIALSTLETKLEETHVRSSDYNSLKQATEIAHEFYDMQTLFYERSGKGFTFGKKYEADKYYFEIQTRFMALSEKLNRHGDFGCKSAKDRGGQTNVLLETYAIHEDQKGHLPRLDEYEREVLHARKEIYPSVLEKSASTGSPNLNFPGTDGLMIGNIQVQPSNCNVTLYSKRIAALAKKPYANITPKELKERQNVIRIQMSDKPRPDGPTEPKRDYPFEGVVSKVKDKLTRWSVGGWNKSIDENSDPNKMMLSQSKGKTTKNTNALAATGINLRSESAREKTKTAFESKPGYEYSQGKSTDILNFTTRNDEQVTLQIRQNSIHTVNCVEDAYDAMAKLWKAQGSTAVKLRPRVVIDSITGKEDKKQTEGIFLKMLAACQKVGLKVNNATGMQKLTLQREQEEARHIRMAAGG